MTEIRLVLDEDWMTPMWLAANLRCRAADIAGISIGDDDIAGGLRRLAESIERQPETPIAVPRAEVGRVVGRLFRLYMDATTEPERNSFEQAHDMVAALLGNREGVTTCADGTGSSSRSR